MLADYHWSRYTRMIDIGGGPGTVLEAVLKAHPQMQGVLFDQPQVRTEKVHMPSTCILIWMAVQDFLM